MSLTCVGTEDGVVEGLVVGICGTQKKRRWQGFGTYGTESANLSAKPEWKSSLTCVGTRDGVVEGLVVGICRTQIRGGGRASIYK